MNGFSSPIRGHLQSEAAMQTGVQADLLWEIIDA